MNATRVRGILTALFATLGFGSLLFACDTPVYRYAMYRWQPGPYRVFYFHRGQPAKEDAQVNRLLDEASIRPAPTNLVFEAIDVSKADALERLPEEVKTSWQAHRDGPLPIHVVHGSRGGEVWSGRLDVAGVQAMLESPARKQIAQMLHDGHATVLVFMPGADPTANERAERVLREAVRQAGAQEASAAAAADPAKPAPKASPGEAAEDDPAFPPEAKPLRMGMLKLDRADPKEQWLARGLLGIEKIPADQEKQPVLYAVFGRGRALGPCLGDQITAESIDELAAFLGGACSCVIKDQNPGVDLLFSWNWDETAERLAESEERPDADMPGYSEVPADAESVPPADAKEAVASPSDVARTASPPHEATEEGPGAKPAPPAPSPPAAAAATPPAPVVAAIALPTAEGETGQPESFTARQMWKYGVGLAVVAAVVLVAGVVLLRKSRDDTP